jgi:transcriptional regulator with XRE-family HTH domain
MTLGQVVQRARSRAQLSQREVAARILREDGQRISAQYVYDIEAGRRTPRSDLIVEQLASALNIPRQTVFYYANRFPPELREIEADDQRIVDAYTAFHRIVTGS